MDALMDIKTEFDYSNHRAEKARAARYISRLWRIALTMLSVTLAVGGIALLAVSIALGWLMVGIAFIPAMIVVWWQGELEQLKVSKKPSSITDVVSGDVLGRLSKRPTSEELVTIIGTTKGGYFFGARFGLTAGLLQNLATQEHIPIESVWKESLRLYDDLKLEQITPGVLIAAYLKQVSGIDRLLAHLHLEYTDVIEGVVWQEHLNALIARHKRPKRTGGIARDWSFGYTPLLSRFGRNISTQVAGGTFTVEIDSHKQAVQQLLDTFGSGGAQNAVLVGPTGVGKTTLVEAFAETLLDANATIPSTLKFRQVIMLDSSSLLAAAPGKGQLEELIMRILSEAYAAKNIIICLDNAQLFFEEGVGSVDISNVLQPILEAGNLRIILTMDEQRFLKISARNAGLANSLNRISIAPAAKEETFEVIQDQLIITEFKRKVTFTYQSLQEIYRLSSRYVHDIAMPGQALKLLESSAGYAEKGLVTINSVQNAIEQTMDIKISVASESKDREKLLNLESLIHERMIGQQRAVTVVSDALRRARAGVRSQDRPIGTFLFLGPTGVGKTELAKALADVYFGGEERMIRLDMNEYVRSDDVGRLIADGANDPMSLTARVMKQPYSVVLLDEIEKAHPDVVSTLLQLLDEGILRDINNREISFRDAVVVATSNAGADRIREYIERGYKLEQFEQQILNELINSNQFRPEFLNRFDEIVTFAPLSKDELIQVVDIMIAGVNKTLALQKVSVEVEQSGKEYLVERGYDPRLGARPMRRIIQRAVENTIAKLMLGGQVEAGALVTISKEQIEQMLGAQVTANDIATQSQS
jgi:ATP-dependent Clp protease ATP-binding subunit ClpC